MLCKEVIDKLEGAFPPYYGESWDNIGLLSGRMDKEIQKVYIALDATDQTIERAVEGKADFMLTHHPFIFSPLKKVQAHDFIGRRLIHLIQNDICYYAMHTNFDVLAMADLAGDILHLQNKKVLGVMYEEEDSHKGIGCYGYLPKPITLEECCHFVKKAFTLDWVKVFGNEEKMVRTAAIVPGSGKSFIKKALEAKVDVLITGDMDHHEGIDALLQGLCIIDGGHYGLEYCFVPYMKQFFEKEMKGLEVDMEQRTSPFRIL